MAGSGSDVAKLSPRSTSIVSDSEEDNLLSETVTTRPSSQSLDRESSPKASQTNHDEDNYMKEYNWKSNWPSYSESDTNFCASRIFDSLNSNSEDHRYYNDRFFVLPPIIRDYYMHVSTGPHGEYVDTNARNGDAKQGRAAHRRRIPRRIDPDAAASNKRSRHKGSLSDAQSFCGLNKSNLNLLSESNKPIYDLPDDISDLTTLTDLEDEDHKGGPRLIGHLPRAEREALKTFTLIENNTYLRKGIGSSGLPGRRPCACRPQKTSNRFGYDPKVCCREESQCINRICNIECNPLDCIYKRSCGNQRIQNKTFAPLEIVKTRKKGFGVRAAHAINSDDFVCEYLGEVITHDKFEDRVQLYAQKKNKHIYMMHLQKGEYIDATRKGGWARFVNHSCNPNCEIQQWVVGSLLRMVLVAKRDILAGEELSFNYNMMFLGDTEAQICYCRETSCAGYIGASMPSKPTKKFTASSTRQSTEVMVHSRLANKKISVTSPGILQPRKRGRPRKAVSSAAPYIKEGKYRCRVCGKLLDTAFNAELHLDEMHRDLVESVARTL